MLQNAPLIVQIGVDTEENEPPKNCEKLIKESLRKDRQNSSALLRAPRRSRSEGFMKSKLGDQSYASKCARRDLHNPSHLTNLKCQRIQTY